MNDDGKKNTINGVIGSTFITPEGQKLLIERELGDGLLHIVSLPSGTTFRVEDPETGNLMLPDTAWLERELAQNGLRFLADASGPVAPERQTAKLFDREEILKLDPYAEARLVLMLGLINKGIDGSNPRLSAEIDELWTPGLEAKHGPRPTTATVREWFGRCNGATVDLNDMLSMSGRVPRANRLEPEVEMIIDEERKRFWMHRGFKIVDVAAAVLTRVLAENTRRVASGEPQLTLPGKETIRRRVNEMLCRDTYALKFGEKAAKRKFDGSGRGITAYKILQIGLMDDAVIDLVTCLDVDRGLIAGRPYLTVLIDVHSRCVVAASVSFQPPSVRKAADCIRIALQCVRSGNQPKIDIRPERLARYPNLARINGKFTKIVTDNGTNFVSPGFSEMLLDLGITHELAPVGAPRHKAIIERFFHTLNTWLIGKLPGSTLDPSILRKLGIDPTAEAIVTTTELKELLAEFLYVYHISHHSGIDAVPLQKWGASMAVHGRDMILDGRKVDIVTGVTVHNKRVTANGGVRMFGMTWKGENLQNGVINPLCAAEPHRDRIDGTTVVTTKIKYNPEDTLYIHVFVGDDWVRLENTQPEYAAGLGLWQHKQIQNWAKQQHLDFNTQAERLAARDDLNKMIRTLFPDMDARERRAMARMCGATPEPTFEVVFAEAEPRHDGMGPIIEHDAPANEREDAQRPTSRPAIEKPNDDTPGDETNDDTPDDETNDGEDHEPVLGKAKPIVEPAEPDEHDDNEDGEYA
ncbi:transposase family protein [Sphingomonas sp. UYEF23]|uniref:transposase family protein n=1 Tax=Sphingomonas sp. UYEF23 TaxID=1756408 RepID=UPI00339423CD